MTIIMRIAPEISSIISGRINLWRMVNNIHFGIQESKKKQVEDGVNKTTNKHGCQRMTNPGVILTKECIKKISLEIASSNSFKLR